MAAPGSSTSPTSSASFSDHWNPRIVGRYNGNEVRVAKLEGEFTWHSHAETDELFLVLTGDSPSSSATAVARSAPAS